MLAPYILAILCMFHIARHERRIRVTRSLERSIQIILAAVEQSQEIEEESFAFLKDDSGYWPGLPWEGSCGAHKMIELVAESLARKIGVSNILCDHVWWLLKIDPS